MAVDVAPPNFKSIQLRVAHTKYAAESIGHKSWANKKKTPIRMHNQRSFAER